MRQTKLFAVAVCLPSSNLAFHAVPNCHVKFRLRANPISTSTCSSFDRHDRLPWRPEVSHERPRAQVFATPQLEGEAKDHLSWMDGVELDSQGKVCVHFPKGVNPPCGRHPPDPLDSEQHRYS